jgi:hypothetical protein
MSVERRVTPYLLKVISQLEPFFFFITSRALASRRVTPYAFRIVQYGKFFAYSFHRALGAVILRLFPAKERVFFETLPFHFLGKKQVGGDSFARCARLPPELAGHMFNIGDS